MEGDLYFEIPVQNHYYQHMLDNGCSEADWGLDDSIMVTDIYWTTIGTLYPIYTRTMGAISGGSDYSIKLDDMASAINNKITSDHSYVFNNIEMALSRFSGQLIPSK